MDQLSQAALDLANASVRTFTHGVTEENTAQLRKAVGALVPMMDGLKPEEVLGDVVRRCIRVDLRDESFSRLPADSRLGYVAAVRAVNEVALAMRPVPPMARIAALSRSSVKSRRVTAARARCQIVSSSATVAAVC